MPVLDIFFSMMVFFLWIAWIMLVVHIFIDIFRSADLNGWAKGLWALFVVFLPFLGVLVYLIARGNEMQQRSIDQAAERDAAARQYIGSVAGDSQSTADQLEQLSNLLDKGALSDAEFQSEKAKLLG